MERITVTAVPAGQNTTKFMFSDGKVWHARNVDDVEALRKAFELGANLSPGDAIALSWVNSRYSDESVSSR